MCTALNWKQPNCSYPASFVVRLRTNESIDPVLLGNELGADPIDATADSHKVHSSGRTTVSVKEAVQIAQNNNLMGLICSSRLLVCWNNLFLHLAPNLRCRCLTIINRNSRLLSSSLSKRPALSLSQTSPRKRHRSPTRPCPRKSMDTSKAKAYCASTRLSISEVSRTIHLSKLDKLAFSGTRILCAER